jgi:hypothetical protein
MRALNIRIKTAQAKQRMARRKFQSMLSVHEYIIAPNGTTIRLPSWCP